MPAAAARLPEAVLVPAPAPLAGPAGRAGARPDDDLPVVRRGEPRAEPPPRGASRRSRSTIASSRSRPTASSSAARASATSGSRTRTSRDVTPRSSRTATTGWTVVDLGSTNGTEVNGRRIAKRTPLDDGDRIADRRHRARLRPLAQVRLAVTVDETLLALKIGFLVLLYLFVWLVVRSRHARTLRGAPQESIILPAAEAAALRAALAPPSRRRRRAREPGAPAGNARSTSRAPPASGAGPRTPIRLDGDTSVSSRHATLDSRARRALGRGRGLDERDLRERGARHGGAPAGPGGRRPHRPDRPRVDS